MAFFFVMNRRPPRSTRTDTLFPYTTLFRSRIVFTSPGLSGLVAAVGAGLGVTIRTPEGLPAPLAPLDADCGLPELGSTEVSLHRADGARRPAVDSFLGTLQAEMPAHLRILKP